MQCLLQDTKRPKHDGDGDTALEDGECSSTDEDEVVSVKSSSDDGGGGNFYFF